MEDWDGASLERKTGGERRRCMEPGADRGGLKSEPSATLVQEEVKFQTRRDSRGVEGRKYRKSPF